MNENKVSMESRVLMARVHEEVDKSISLQIELNKLAEERDFYKEAFEKNKKNTEKHFPIPEPMNTESKPAQ